jgi:hypothetical protein
MDRKKIIYLIIFVSFICLIFAVKVNINTYQDYIQSTEKTRALFGLSELKFSYRYYLGILSLIGFIISANYLRKKENRILVSIAMLISILAMIVSFFRIWRIFI